MSHPAAHHKINYIEFAATDVARAKQFYSSVFGWTFDDYGPDYASFHAASAGIDGGFYKADPHDPLPKVAPLIVALFAESQGNGEGDCRCRWKHRRPRLLVSRRIPLPLR